MCVPDVLAKPAIEKAVEDGCIQFVPKQYENMYFSRMRDIRDGYLSSVVVGLTVFLHGMTTAVGKGVMLP